jgi:hypothetical protein
MPQATEVEVTDDFDGPVVNGVKITRENRRPFGARDPKLAWPPRLGFHRHWFNDTEDRIARAQQGGYTFVKDQDGRVVEKSVGNRAGQQIKGFLMEMPIAWRNEDLAARENIARELDEKVYNGTYKAGPEDKRYVPEGAISFQEGTGPGRG